MFLLGFTKREVLRSFLRHGGRETLLSYPIDAAAYADADFEETQRLMLACVPAEDRAWLEECEDSISIGDYHFVHAGIRPGVPLDEQKRADLRWIREDFIDCRDSHGPVIVHGHTIFDAPDIQPNRIGIDTGAYASGRLTALGLESTSRWLLETSTTDSTVAVSQRTLP
jgi:serine/threonine protein phosphatase 1